MKVIDFLLNRRSTPALFLDEPAPSGENLDLILSAAVTAPDHGGLRPWRFLVIEGQARESLGNLLAKAAQQQQPTADQAQLDNIRKKPLRSPMIIAVIAQLSENPKVPHHEQLLSAGMAAHNIMLAADSLGFGAIWLTGPLANNELVQKGLHLTGSEQVVAFVYLGTPNQLATKAIDKALDRPDPAAITQQWPIK